MMADSRHREFDGDLVVGYHKVACNSIHTVPFYCVLDQSASCCMTTYERKEHYVTRGNLFELDEHIAKISSLAAEQSLTLKSGLS